MQNLKNYGVILASGSGSRYGADIPKQFVKIAGKTILEHTIEIFEKAQMLYGKAMNERGWSHGRYDCEKKTTNLEPLGYRTEYLENEMEMEIRSLQSSGYDYFIPITNEEKETLFKQVKEEIENTTSSNALEDIKYKYSNFIEIVDLVNDAHIRLDK